VDAPLLSEPAADSDEVYLTKALRKLLTTLSSRETPVVLDLGPVVGSNITFFGEQIGCKVIVEDLYADVERHTKEGKLDALPAFLKTRLSRPDGSVDGIVCWDLFDYLDRPSAQELGLQLTRLLRPGGSLLGFFSTAQARDNFFTKYIVIDEGNLRHRRYAASQGRRPALANRDVIRLFPGLAVTDSFLLKNHLREILFRKTA
jgi:hypothetical protein